MPVESQQRRPLGRRDRVVIAAVVCAAAIAAGAGSYAYVRNSGSSDEGCVVVTVPASLGGERLRRCGSRAVVFCRDEGPRNSSIADACRRAGITVRPIPASKRPRPRVP